MVKYDGTGVMLVIFVIVDKIFHTLFRIIYDALDAVIS
jgi:hypothetical protein